MKIKPKKKRARANTGEGTSKKARIGVDLVAGLPVLIADPDAPVLTSKQVAKMLSNFP
jgi:hypothetical protein